MPNPTQPRMSPAVEHETLEGENLRETRERLEIALEASGMGVWDVDLTTMTARTSLRHNQIFGYTEPVEWSPAIFTEHALPEDRQLVAPAFERAMETGQFELTARVRWPDGSVHWIRDWGRVYRDEEGRPVRMVGVTEEVTEAKRGEEELLAAKRVAEAANRAKSRFLTVMSHELRTPLTGIIASAELLGGLAADGATARQQAAVKRIQSTAWHMTTLIDDLLSLARSEAGREELHEAECDLVRIARQVVGIVATQAEVKGLTLNLEGADEAAPLRTDPGKARQILTNLVGNAVRYTSEGEVGVRVARSADGVVLVAVRDTGPGIALQDQERIFEPFTQLRSELPGGAGTGLGLAIARRLARMLGGDVLLESEPGVGSTFTFRLPPTGAP
ncbi:MAG: PAS domain-containing protein [Gemmatimonadetes bacterium]|nr:PAS domain-containing protein [Gemmatimonadota bacterium]